MSENTFTKLYQQVTTCVNNESSLSWGDKLALVPDKNKPDSSDKLQGKVEIRGWWRRRGCWIWSQAYRNMAEKTFDAIDSEYGKDVATRVFKSVVGDPNRNQQVTLKQFRELKHRLQFEGKISTKHLVRESMSSLYSANNNISQLGRQPSNSNNYYQHQLTLHDIHSNNTTSDYCNIEAIKPRPGGGTKYSEVSKQIKRLVGDQSDKSKHIRFKAPSWDQERIFSKPKGYRRFNRHMVRKNHTKRCNRGPTGGFYLHKPTFGSSLGIGNWWSGESPQKKREATGRAIYESLCNEYGNEAANLVFKKVFLGKFMPNVSRQGNNLNSMATDIAISIDDFKKIDDQVETIKSVLADRDNKPKNGHNNILPQTHMLPQTRMITVISGEEIPYGNNTSPNNTLNESDPDTVKIYDTSEDDTSWESEENDETVYVNYETRNIRAKASIPTDILDKLNQYHDEANDNRNEQ